MPDRPTSTQLFGVADAAYRAAIAEARVERARSEARVARLRHAAELEHLGRYDEAKVILDEVRADREAEQ